MVPRPFLSLCLAQIAEHKLVNVLPHGCVELIFDFNGVVAALSFNSFELTGRMHFALEIELLATLIVLVLSHKQIRLQAVFRPCLQALNLGGVGRAVVLRDCN